MLVGLTALSEEIITKFSIFEALGDGGDVVGALNIVFDRAEDDALPSAERACRPRRGRRRRYCEASKTSLRRRGSRMLPISGRNVTFGNNLAISRSVKKRPVSEGRSR